MSEKMKETTTRKTPPRGFLDLAQYYWEKLWWRSRVIEAKEDALAEELRELGDEVQTDSIRNTINSLPK